MSNLHEHVSGTVPPWQIGFAFGRSHCDTRWISRRMMFEAFAEMLAKPEIGGKNGACYTPAIFRGEARGQDYAAEIGVAVLDSDCGHTFDEIKAAVQQHGWKAVIHSTYSHLSDETVINGTAYERWLAANPGCTIANFLAAKKDYLPRVIQDARIVDTIRSDGGYTVKHAPCPRFRIVLPLEEPWVAEHFPDQRSANVAWREHIGALVHALGLKTDQSCVDTGRVFYLPRKRADQEYVYALLPGQECPIWTLPAAPVAGPPRSGMSQLGHGTSTSRYLVQKGEAEPFDLVRWAAAYAERFEIWTAIDARAPQLKAPRTNGVKRHVVCPFVDEHTDPDERSGTFVVNASELPQAGLTAKTSGFVVHCMHAACSGRDRLEYVARMLDDGILTVADLTAPEFLIPEPEIDTSGLLGNLQARASDSSKELPAGILEVEGVLKQLMDYVLTWPGRPQPFLALGGSIAAIGAVAGRKYASPSDLRTNIYGVGLVDSGGGKDAARKGIKRTMVAANLGHYLCGENIASGRGLRASLEGHPAKLLLLDEFGRFLGKVNARNAGGHEMEILTTMTELFTSASEIRLGDEYANQKERPRVDIHQPHLCLWGTTVANTLWGALQSGALSDGSLARILVFQAPVNYPSRHKSCPGTPPVELVDEVKRIAAGPQGHDFGGNLASAAMMLSSISLNPYRVLYSPEAAELLAQLESDEDSWLRQNEGTWATAFIARFFENVVRVAMIRAISRDPQAPVIQGLDVRWAYSLVEHCIVTALRETDRHVSDNETQHRHNKVLEIVRKAGPNGITGKDLNRRTTFLNRRDRNEIIDTLVENGDVVKTSLPGTTRPINVFVALQGKSWNRNSAAASGIVQR